MIWRDSDDGIIQSVERDRSTQHITVGAEAALPEAVAQDDHAWSATTILLGQETASKNRLNTKRSEEVGSDGSADQSFGFFTTGEAEVPYDSCGHLFEAPALISPVHEVRQRGYFATDLRMIT